VSFRTGQNGSQLLCRVATNAGFSSTWSCFAACLVLLETILASSNSWVSILNLMAVVKMLANKCDDGNDAISAGSLYVIRIGRDLHVMIVWDPLEFRFSLFFHSVY